jgi:hypothetical protein
MKCVGYEATQTVYDPVSFAPKKMFTSMKQNDIDNERQNNTIWQDWVRARR